MRRRHAVVLVSALAGLAAACADSGGRTTGAGAGPSGGPTSEPDVALSGGTRLASAEIGVETRGAWTYRRTAGSAGEGRATKDGAPMASKALHREGLDAKGERALHDASDVATLESSGAVVGVGVGGAGPGRAGAGPMPPRLPATDAASAPPEAGGDSERSKRRGLAAASGGKSRPDSDAAVARALRAGATDDNTDFAGFVQFLDGWQKREGMTGRFQPLDVRTRKFVRVLDSAGRPVPAARVAVVDESKDRVVGRGTTYGDGRVPLYPRVGAAGERDASAPAGGWFVEVRVGEKVVRSHWDGAGDEHVVDLGAPVTAPEIVPIDVAFLIDTTGSMGDEIASIQACLLRVTAQIRSLARETDLRCGTVLYRDVGDAYLTATHPLTADVGALDKALRDVSADGGGDGPESLNQGLAETVGGLEWRDGAAKVVFLIADAPPHMDYAGDTPYGESARAAVAMGIRVHTVAASGIDDVGSLVFRQIAQFTRGKFIFLEYGGDVAKSGAAHGVGAGAVQKNDNLEDILFEQIRDEVARFGR